MPNIDQLRAFVLAADLGSFSAAARRLGKAQSAVSTAVSNLEIDADVVLFDRTHRNPELTESGQSLLTFARGVLLGCQEFNAKATSLSEGVEDQLCLALEQGVLMQPLLSLLSDFADEFPQVAIEILDPGPNDVASLLKDGRADLGLMAEQESYPQGFQFRGVGHMQLVPVCGRDHPLAKLETVTYGDLRRYRQLIPHSRSLLPQSYLGERKSASVWYAESPFLILELLPEGLGWAELPAPVVAEGLSSGQLVHLSYDFQQSDILQGIDVVWTEQRALGVAGQWVLQRLLTLPQAAWRESGLSF